MWSAKVICGSGKTEPSPTKGDGLVSGRCLTLLSLPEKKPGHLKNQTEHSPVAVNVL